MKFTSSEDDAAKVPDFFMTLVASAGCVDRPLTEKDAVVLMLAGAPTNNAHLDQRLSDLEAELLAVKHVLVANGIKPFTNN